jgi:hypothetical protein
LQKNKKGDPILRVNKSFKQCLGWNDKEWGRIKVQPIVSSIAHQKDKGRT